MSYILEGEAEVERLQHQSQIHAYNIREELANNTLPSRGDRVLDVGCGHGMVSRYLCDQVEGINIQAVDISSQRIEQGRELSQGYPIEFWRSDASCMPFAERSFDYLVCRYVFEYFQRPYDVAKEFRRLLTPEGRAIVIVFDGAFFNLQAPDAYFTEELRCLTEALRGHVNCYVGRQVPVLMKQAGFQNVRVDPRVYHFEGESLKNEIENTKLRFKLSRPVLLEALGTKGLESFESRYMRYLEDPASFLFYNKFIVEAF